MPPGRTATKRGCARLEWASPVLAQRQCPIDSIPWLYSTFRKARKLNRFPLPLQVLTPNLAERFFCLPLQRKNTDLANGSIIRLFFYVPYLTTLIACCFFENVIIG